MPLEEDQGRLAMSRLRAITDAAVIGGMSLVYVVMEALHVQKRWSFVVVGVALLAYGVLIARQRTHSFRDLGFRLDNLRAGLLPVGICTLIASVGLIAWAVALGRPLLGNQILILLALYPIWATVQQLAFQGLLHRGLMVLLPTPTLQVLITATAFASVHVGNATLVALTFTAGLMWSLLYRRWPNLWLLAGSQTILAALAYPLVLGDAPLSRL